MIAIGSDHGGLELKESIEEYLIQKGYEVKDFGVDSFTEVDYPDIAADVCTAVINGKCEKGILVCGTGIGISIAANKIDGIRAALCSDSYSARMAKEHNDANIITMGGRVIGVNLAYEIVDAWIEAKFLGDKHQVRVDKIHSLENKG